MNKRKEDYIYLKDKKMIMYQCCSCKCHFYCSEYKIGSKYLKLPLENLVVKALHLIAEDFRVNCPEIKENNVNDLIDFYLDKAIGVAENEF